jgi:hypothetical protein
MEQIVDAKEKLKQQKIYTHFMNNGEKALIVRWKQDVNLLSKILFINLLNF